MDKVAIVGSRRGADLADVEQFVRALYAKYPDTLLISGGADGVDHLSEKIWLELGGHVWSYRVRELSPDSFGIEMWDLGNEPRCFLLTEEPTFANRTSALFYRDALIAEHANRVVAFYRRGRSAGTQVTVDFAVGAGKDVHEFEAMSVAA